MYKQPSWRNEKLANASPHQIEQWREENARIDAENAAAYESRAAAHSALLAAARDTYRGIHGALGDKHPVIKAIRKHSIARPAWKAADLFERELKAALDAKAKAEQEVIRAREAEQLVEDAIPWLAKRGKVLGVDYTLSEAVRYANDIAYDEEVARRVAEGGPFEFGGDDYCENCSGWDGESRRCECGNRRVGWEKGWGHTYKNPSVYAEAF